ncbi:hypothetical protein AB4097_08915 [Microvirga sp. 2MCAF35]|uniref:hypothetical protein n=1 Tax=Microvirga sp. 2MCAF35 TaxID=3232987 RepID=UPI003F9A5B1F
MIEAIRSLETFIHRHREVDQRIKSYVRDSRKNYAKLDPSVERLLDPKAAIFLHVYNADARIQFATSLIKHTAEIVQFIGPGRPAYFVTLTPDIFCHLMQNQRPFTLQDMKKWVAQYLGDLNAVGVIEAGYYRRTRRGLAWILERISWHFHLLVWGASYYQINQRLKAIRGQHQSLVVEIPSAACKTVASGEEFEEQAYYMSKGILSSYSYGEGKPDPKTGEIRVVHKKREPRTGEHIRMCNVLKDEYIDNLLFGFGDGEGICKRVKRDLLSGYHKAKREDPKLLKWNKPVQRSHPAPMMRKRIRNRR